MIINLNRLSHELSGTVADRERSRIQTQLSGIERCPHCGSPARLDAIIAPPPVDAGRDGDEERRRSVLSDYHVGARFDPCEHEVDLRTIDGITITLRDGPIEVDYHPDSVIN